MKINKLFIIFFILILGMGIASATDNQTICNNTGITSLEDANINVNVLSDQHEISHELQGKIEETHNEGERPPLKNQENEDNSEIENQWDKNIYLGNLRYESNSDLNDQWDESNNHLDDLMDENIYGFIKNHQKKTKATKPMKSSQPTSQVTIFMTHTKSK